MDVYACRWLLPVVSPPVEGGAVAVDGGRISAAGSLAEVRAAVGADTPVKDLGDVAILPGLVNAHTHLELAWMGADPPAAGDYVAWVRDLLSRRAGADPGRARDAAAAAIDAIVARGTVAVGDVGNGAWTAPLLARSPLRGVAFHELYGLEPGDAEPALAAAVEQLERLSHDEAVVAAAGRVSLALTPHAPHTTSLALLRALAGRSAAADAPLTIHVAESAAEVELLQNGSGPLAELFDERGFRPDGWTAPGRSPVEHLKRAGVLSPRTMAVHCVHLEQQDHSALQASRVTVVACPRSNRALGVGTAPVPTLMREGIPVALGTDSPASAPDLDLFAEMAALRADHPTLSPAAVLRMATLNGARALGLGDVLGTIEPGKLAELIVVPLDGAAPAERVCSVPDRVFRLDAVPGNDA